ncbi:hypothetical protein BVRB_036480 [Beta vulgaris subsp. vulgaris]|uniref:CHY-type domain-containing protein n=1 Tax=Beta vulgaris subsp. vulgaris TaxID=3555 RepID=A0A0J7YPC6_BETVV|nr:hypothetical protein BVRB_036480 [Beta vulgaris subsp. vulgaris]
MTLVCGDVELVGKSTAESATLSKKSKQETASEKPSLRPARSVESLSAVKKGTPLPDFGTCKHYSKSYRWLRFPCCGKAFPCDICHELGTASNPHEMKWALRQICGYCSQESAISGTGKCPCGRSKTICIVDIIVVY